MSPRKSSPRGRGEEAEVAARKPRAGTGHREGPTDSDAAEKSGAERKIMLCVFHVEATGTLIMNLMDFGGQKLDRRGLGVSDLRGMFLRD